VDGVTIPLECFARTLDLLTLQGLSDVGADAQNDDHAHYDDEVKHFTSSWSSKILLSRTAMSRQLKAAKPATKAARAMCFRIAGRSFPPRFL
jgi:hypothetical protein